MYDLYKFCQSEFLMSESNEHNVVIFHPFYKITRNEYGYINSYINNEEIDKISKDPVVEVEGIVVDDENNFLAFIVPDSQKVAEYIYECSDGNPSNYFSIETYISDDKFIVMIMPDSYKMINEYKIHFQIKTGYPFPDNIDINAIFRPIIHKGIDESGEFRKYIEKSKDTKIDVCMADPKSYSENRWKNSNIIEIGNMNISINNEDVKPIYDSIFPFVK